MQAEINVGMDVGRNKTDWLWATILSNQKVINPIAPHYGHNWATDWEEPPLYRRTIGEIVRDELVDTYRIIMRHTVRNCAQCVVTNML